MELEKLRARFEAKFERGEPDECWEWQGWRVPGGYGQFTIGGGKRAYAHRVAYLVANGEVFDGIRVDHACYNTSCVNPAHLRGTTNKENCENRKGASSNSKSGIRGVYWRSDTSKWQVQVRHHGKLIHGGYFDSLTEAENAAIAKRNELFTHNDLDRLPTQRLVAP